MPTYLDGLPAAVLVPLSQSVAWGLRWLESPGSSLSVELSLETDAVTKSPSISDGFALLRMQAGLGRGNNDDLVPFSDLTFVDMPIPESVRTTLDECRLGSGSGCAWVRSAKLWLLETSLEGDGDIDSIGDLEPLSETVSIQCFLDAGDLLFTLPSDVFLNFLCNVSIKLSLLSFFLFASLDDDFPHHDGMVFVQWHKIRAQILYSKPFTDS